MIKQIDIKQFTVFEQASLEFSPGVNVLIGANGTGKTHVLKLLYSFARTRQEFYLHAHKNNGHVFDQLAAILLSDRLLTVFRPDDRNLGQVIRLGSSEFSVKLLLDEGEIELTWNLSGGVSNSQFKTNKTSDVLYIPAREVLSFFPGFMQAYKNRELAFDETYYDLCLALSGVPLRGPRGEEAFQLLGPLAEQLQLKVILKGDHFYLGSDDGLMIEAHLVAEGVRKVGSLIHLIANGSLTKNSVLFWDEPEANLNPKLIKIVADFLLRLAGDGVQIFVATHDYLLTNELSLQAEYQTEAARKAPIKFFGFQRGQDGGVSVQPGNTLIDLDHNPIMEEFAAFYDRERSLFADLAPKP